MGRKWNIRLGQSTSSLDRQKPPPSKWLEAAVPVRLNSHSRPTSGRLRHLRPSTIETGWSEAYWM